MTRNTPAPGRGRSHPNVRVAECKDCLREFLSGAREDGTQYFNYPETWATAVIERGGSRSDRCREHRVAHDGHIAGLTVAYIDLDTTGEVTDRDHPTGPLGALGPLPAAHNVADTPGVDLDTFGFGMDETHIRAILHHLADADRRVLVVKAGTGTGKSTYMPYKLLDPPAGAFPLTALGPIIVTEPRVQATVGVATFVGKELSGTGGVGPGYPVGFQVKGNRQHDSACQLVYVTDGTIINWLREGRLSTIGTVIVDEAHERSTNIDFILGFLHRELDRYPHLRIIITSATFDAEFYRQYFGAHRTSVLEIPAVKTIGYGWPLFGELDAPPAGEKPLASWSRLAPELHLAPGPGPSAPEEFITRAWPRYADPLGLDDVVDPADSGYTEDLHATTRTLLDLRSCTTIPIKAWKEDMPAALADFVVSLTTGLDSAGIYGDILAFLPTARAIEEACAIVTSNLGDLVDVYPLIASLPTPEKEAALSARRKGDRRKIVISTNLAETSLTVEGVRFVVDSGLIAQNEWDVRTAQGDVRTKAHSQSGIKQRWGRVGRKAPGWVFPLYSKDQLLTLNRDTSPGSTRSNLENLVLTALLGGLASVYDISWPAAFEPQPPVTEDAAARTARAVFIRELARAETALHANGALDDAGDPTSFGKELSRLQVLGSASAAIAIMYADRLACVPEVATILTLLHGTGRVWLVSTTGMLLSDHTWPDEWRLEAAERHRALASACEDDAELVLQVVAAWERADPTTPPWQQSSSRAAWAAQWWVNHDTLLTAAAVRRDILAPLSPILSEEVKRFVEPSLLRRARGAITRAFAHLEHTFDGTAFTPSTASTSMDTETSANGEPVAGRQPQGDPISTPDPDTDLSDDEVADLVAIREPATAAESREGAGTSAGGFGPILVHGSTLTTPPARSIPLNRSRYAGTTYVANFVTAEPWAHDTETSPGPAAAVRLLLASARHGRIEPHRDLIGAIWAAWPAGTRACLRFAVTTEVTVTAVTARHDPAPLPVAAEELAALDAAHAAAHGGGTTGDAAPELDTSWPTPNTPAADLESLAHTAVLDHRDFEAVEYACGTCLPCLDGDLSQCTDPRGTRGDSAAQFASTPDKDLEPLAAWRARAAAGTDMTTPTVVPISGTPLDDDAWYEICAYTPATQGRPPAIVIRTDWRVPDHVWGPAQHPDLSAGDHIEVHVGGTVRDHHGDLRVFTRTDGRGRFLLREAIADTGKQAKFAQLAISLGDRDTGQLADLLPDATLVATALPRSRRDHFTITLLDLSAGHLQNAPGAGRAGNSTPAVVLTTRPNGKYVEVNLLAIDPATGLRHRLSGPLNGTPPPDPGDPVLVDVRRANTHRLPLQGRPLAELRDLLDTVTGVRLAGLPTDRPLPPVGTYQARLESTSEISTATALDLATLQIDATWARDVWQLWARSRHRWITNVRPGQTSQPIAYPARPRVELAPELHLPGADLLSLHPIGSRTTAVVTAVRDEVGRAWLRLPDGAPASLAAKDADLADGRTLSQEAPMGGAITGYVTGVFDKGNGPAQITLRLRELPTAARIGAQTPPPVPTLDRARASYPPGSQITATVKAVRGGRAFLELPDRLPATCVTADVGATPVLDLASILAVGQTVTGHSAGVSEQRGAAQVHIQLPDLPVPTVWEQLEHLGIRSGATWHGRVTNTVDDLGVFVRLTPALSGLIHVRTLAGRAPSTWLRDEAVIVQVVSLREDRKRKGWPAIDLRLAGPMPELPV